MSDTPRTDALDHRTCAFGLSYRLTVHADLCRELERELTEAREWSSTLADFGDDLRAQVGELLEALDMLTGVIGLTPVAGNKEALQEAYDIARAVIERINGGQQQ